MSLAIRWLTVTALPARSRPLPAAPRQPWWVRRAIDLLALGSLLLMVGGCAFVLHRLQLAYEQDTQRAHAELDALGYAGAMSLPRPEGLSLARRDGGARVEVLADRRSGAAPAEDLNRVLQPLLQGRRAGLQLLDDRLRPLLWVGSAESGTPESGSRVWQAGDPRNPRHAEARHRWLVGKAHPLSPGRGYVRAASLEADILRPFYARWDTAWVLLPLLSTVLALLTFLATHALRRIQRSESQLHRLATTDKLTGLLNRSSFNEALMREAASARRTEQRLGLLFIDLDNFKHVNDSLGHHAGDELLKIVSNRLQASVRDTDTVCRLGGDEFVVIVGQMRSRDEAAEVAQRVLQALLQPTRVSDQLLAPQASIGIALLDDDAEELEDLVRCADMALYAAKNKGKSCAVRFTGDLARHDLRVARLAQDLRHGLDRDEVFIEYQPQFRLQDGALVGFEALVRWKHPQEGRIAPSEFVPIAESTGLMARLGEQVMTQALVQLRAWHDKGLGWQTVALNLSGLQLRDLAAVQRLQDLLHRHGVPGRCVQIEVAESTLAARGAEAAEALAAFKALGVAIAVDDFGTGCASLLSLQQWQVDILKVDPSFVQHCLADTGQREICRTIIRLGHVLGMRIVAEGIETDAQRECLLSLGCDGGQGYFFSQVLDGTACADLLCETRLARAASDVVA